MKWVLVFISLTHHGHPIVEEIGRYDSMKDCFFASLVDNNGTGNSSYNIQKILNKISILKTKILKKI